MSNKIYGYTVTTPMNPKKASGVFVGNENTTLAEFFEAYQNKKACFLYRPRGGSGYEQWALYNANTSQARFYMIEQNGKIMVGTLKSNGDWSYVIHESVSEEQIVSVLESYLEEHPIEGGKGDDGFSPTVSVSKSGKVTTVSFTDKDGEKTATINDGADGKTPVKGTDYYTEADKAEMVSAVIAALPDASEVSY